jgi:hypothetical protein
MQQICWNIWKERNQRSVKIKHPTNSLAISLWTYNSRASSGEEHRRTSWKLILVDRNQI